MFICHLKCFQRASHAGSGSLEEVLPVSAQAIYTRCQCAQTKRAKPSQPNQSRTSPAGSHTRNKMDGKEMSRSQKPNGTNALKCDFPVPLDMRPCPTHTLPMELPFTGRTPQIGIKVSPNRQGQGGPGMHSRRLTKLLAGVLRGTKCPLSDPPKVTFSRSGSLGQCGEGKTKVSSRQRKPGQLLGQPLPCSPQQPRVPQPRWWTGCDQGPTLQQGNPDDLTSEKSSNLLLPRRKLVQREIPKHPIKLSGPEGPPANGQIQDEPPGLLPKSWLSVPSQTETQKQSNGGEVRLALFARQRGTQQAVPQEPSRML